jgi:hypothetical protein
VTATASAGTACKVVAPAVVDSSPALEASSSSPHEATSRPPTSNGRIKRLLIGNTSESRCCGGSVRTQVERAKRRDSKGQRSQDFDTYSGVSPRRTSGISRARPSRYGPCVDRDWLARRIETEAWYYAKADSTTKDIRWARVLGPSCP